MASAPISLTATVASYSTSTINLGWIDTEIDLVVEVQRRPVGGLWDIIANVGANIGVYSDTSCSSNAGYYYRIRYYDSDFADSEVEYTYPKAPTGLAVSWSGKTATLTWTNNDVYTYVHVQYKLSSEPTTWTTSTSTLTGTLATYNITVATESTSYDFRIRGNNSTSSLWTEYKTKLNETSGIMAPTNLLLTSASATSVTATWADNSSVEDGYEVYYDDTLFETTAADAETSTITGLTSATEYTIKVRAKDGAYYSAYLTGTITTGTVPDAAAVAVSVTVVSQTALTPTWTCAATNETGFYVYRSTDNVTYTQIGTAAANATSYADTGLSSYTLYYYKVRAYNSYGVSALSSAMNNTTTIDLDPPTNLYADALSSTQIKIYFTVNAGNATNHYVERKTVSGAYSALGNVGDGTTATYTDGTCSANTEYTYRIRAYNSVSGGYGDYSVPVTKKTLSVGTDTVRRSESYIGLGNVLCVSSETPQTSFNAYWRSKPIDFVEIDVNDANKFKTIDRVQLEYVDLYSSTPVTVSLSNDGGTNWSSESRDLGTGTELEAVADFYFDEPVTGKNITLRIASEDSDTGFSWTGIILYYIPRGEYFEV